MPADRGREAFNQGRFYAAHEHWEEVWRGAPLADRPYYQALIQLAAACLKIERGEYGPAVTLLQRSRAVLEAPTPLGSAVRTLLERLEALGPERIGAFPRAWYPHLPPDLTPAPGSG